MSTKRSAKPTKPNQPEAYSVWRAYSPVSLVTETGALPAETMPAILKLTRFNSLKDLMDTVKGHKRYELTEILQQDLRRLFYVEVDTTATDEPYYFNQARKPIEIPYPFAAVSGAKAKKLEVSDFFIKQKGKTGPIDLGGRFGVVVPRMLVPRAKLDAEFCRLAALGDLCSDEVQDIQVIANWLAHHGVPKKLASASAKDDSFRWELKDQIHDRIERLVSVMGSPKLFVGQDEGLYAYLEGEEEKGFSQ